jgi:hypothetical protein
MITLRGPQGDKITFRVDDQVKNLAQVKVGDKARRRDYLESDGDPGREARRVGGGSGNRRRVGGAREKPAAAAVEKTSVTASIEKIDRTMPSITLRIPDGTMVTVKVRAIRSGSSLVKIGDELKITYDESGRPWRSSPRRNPRADPQQPIGVPEACARSPDRLPSRAP